MEKKKYIKPEIKVCQLDTACSILAGSSGTVSGGNEDDWGSDWEYVD